MKGPKTGPPGGTTFDPKRVHFWTTSEIYLLCARVKQYAQQRSDGYLAPLRFKRASLNWRNGTYRHFRAGPWHPQALFKALTSKNTLNGAVGPPEGCVPAGWTQTVLP